MLSDKNTDTSCKYRGYDPVAHAKNIFLPINNDGVVNNIGIINQGRNRMDEHEIVNAVGTQKIFLLDITVQSTLPAWFVLSD